MDRRYAYERSYLRTFGVEKIIEEENEKIYCTFINSGDGG